MRPDRALYSEGALSAGKWLMTKKPGLYNAKSYEFQIMTEIQRAKIILKHLNKTYPKISTPQSRNVFTLLISVLLSAQCTDVNVNNVTKYFIKNIID